MTPTPPLPPEDADVQAIRNGMGVSDLRRRAALDRLAVRLQEAKRERDEARKLLADEGPCEQRLDEEIVAHGNTEERAEAAEAKLQEAERERDRWLAWSDGEYPDDSPGDVIAAYSDGTIILDDGITTWNPLRALAWMERRREDNAARLAAADPEASK